MASYDKASPDEVRKIPRKRVASDLIQGLDSPTDEEKKSYASISNHFNPHHDNTNAHYTHTQPPTELVREASPFRWWSWEILSCLGAAGCLAGIVALLVLYDGRPQESWSNDALTLNGLVALLATLCRMFFMVAVSAALTQGKWNQLTRRREGPTYRLRDFLLFDEAARGPWASAQLIWRFRGLHIACLGAFLTILSLAFGLFSQQLIGLEIDTFELPALEDAGRVVRASWVNTMRQDTAPTGRLVPTEKLAIYDGFMASTVDVPQVTCSTGNCTWPIIPTVGVCGACVDLTDRIRVVNETTPVCVVSAPGGLELRGSCLFTDEQRILQLGPGSGAVFSSNDDAPARDAPHVITEFGVLGIPEEKPLNATINETIAAECALWYCVQAHSISVQQGTLRDEIVETWSKIQDPEDDSVGYIDSQNITFVDIPSSFRTDPGEEYGIQPQQMLTITNYFNTTMNDTHVRAIGVMGIVVPGNDFGEALHIGLNNIDAWIARFARSMTNNIRNMAEIRSPGEGRRNPTPSEGTPPPRKDLDELARYRGTALQNQVIIHVRWLWLIYPAGMVFLATVYLIFEATRTSMLSDVRPWKDDLMVPLCLDLDPRAREVARAGLMAPKGSRELVGYQDMAITRGENGFPKGFWLKGD